MRRALLREEVTRVLIPWKGGHNEVGSHFDSMYMLMFVGAYVMARGILYRKICMSVMGSRRELLGSYDESPGNGWTDKEEGGG
jgi:hypothetical protein